MEVATVFLETSLDTRLAVSFPASATTVADLKRRVGDEHAAAFPHIGHIAVQAIKVNQRGSLYLLTDSMAVRDAFRGTTGAWHLQVDALPHPALHVAHQQMPQVPHGCNCSCRHSSAIHSQPSVAACHQHDSASRSCAALGCRKSSVCEMLTDQAELGAAHTESERAPREKHRAVKRHDTAPAADFDFGLPCVHKEPCNIAGNMCNAANSKEDTHLAPCVEELNQGDTCSEKETWTAKEADSSQQEAMQHNVEEKEPLTAKVCDGERSSNGTDLPPPCAAEATKEGDYSENEAMRCKVDENEPLTAKAVWNSNGSTQGTDLPPCVPESTKEGDSSGKEAMARQVEEKEQLTTKVCNGEGSSQGTDHPPP